MLIPSVVDDDHDYRAFNVGGACGRQLWTMGRPTTTCGQAGTWPRRELRQIRRALALVLLFVRLFVLALVLLFVQLLVRLLVRLVLNLLEVHLVLAFEKVGQHQTIELREPLIGICLALDVCARRMPEPRYCSILVTLGQQSLGIGIEQACRPGLTRTPIELRKLQPHNGLSLIHISEPTRRTPISYAVFCLKKNTNK